MKRDSQKAMFAKLKKQGNNSNLWNDKNRTSGSSWKNVYKISPKNANKILEMPHGEQRIREVMKHNLPTHQVMSMTGDKFKEHSKGTKEERQLDQAINTYFNSWDLTRLYKETDNEISMTKEEFDGEQMFDVGEGAEKIKVAYIGEVSDMIGSIDFPKGSEEFEHEAFDTKLNNLKLHPDYMIYQRDGDVFMVKGW